MQGGAHTELAERLRRAMIDRKMRQSDLATAARVSTGAVSNILNGKSVPGVTTLELLAASLKISGEALEELHQLRDRADVRTRRLDTFLAAAQRAAREHPYPGVIPGAVPPLATVYLHQQVTPHPRLESGSHGGVDAPPRPRSESLPAGVVLSDAQTCVILAGPGGGKSSLLRAHLAAVVERWLQGRGDSVVPVLVPAAALSGPPLTQALASAATAELASYGLTDELPPAFFGVPPQPGVRWLVLVDGLDEVADPVARKEILRTLNAIATGDQADLYRFVVATRPLPTTELDLLGHAVPRLELQSFDAVDVEHVAGSWFGALGLAEPEDTAKRFVQDLARAGLADLARIPLMTSMLCQVHAAAPDTPLPAGRGQIYRDFIDLLHKHQYADGPTGIRTQLCAGLERYGRNAVAKAEHTLDHLQDLIAHLAAERHRGNNSPVVTILESRPEAQRPSRVPADEWLAFLDTSLRRSGLFTIRAGELVFLHQTLLEYFAAYDATRDPDSTALALQKAFHIPARYGLFSRLSGDAPGVKPRLWLWRFWRSPHGDSSFIGFLLDTAHRSNPDIGARYLARLASLRAGLDGCKFIAEQSQLGTLIPGDVLHAAADLCADLATERTLVGDDRLEAIEALVQLGDSRAADLYANLATGTNTAVYPARRVDAVRALVQLGDSRAADLYASLATDTTVGGFRVAAAQELAALDDFRAADLYANLAADAGIYGDRRLEAVEGLARLGDPRAADLYANLATDTGLSGDPHRSGLAAAIAAAQEGLPPYGMYRVGAVHALAALGDPRAADLYANLATDTSLHGLYRVWAIEGLATLGDPRAADLKKLIRP
ncbi:helix-turn-helix domain-containing protein [Streptomyces sp. NPDC006516]|uniref:NACHT domain-containing protein n=1 Tax=Streptomyces sp. NPDC006516 TaxID=3154309 RepID=UPI0033B70F44